MRLPAADQAVVEPAKIRDYLLSAEHPIGRAKAHFFQALGFKQAQWPELRSAILALAGAAEATVAEANAFGQKYLVRGILTGPDGPTADILTVWIVLHGEGMPRFVTAYPGASG